MLFSDLGLKESSLKAVEKLGFTQPTEIQAKAIPVLLEKDCDFIGQAQTGTGKTAAFTLPLLQKIDPKAKGIQALILAPTRELANQIQEEIVKLSHFDTISTMAVYGGVPIWGQIKDLRKFNPKILVGTPGRVIDLMERGEVNFSGTRYFILDEADEMLDMGFFDDVKMILKTIEEKVTWMFSATMPGPIRQLVEEEFDNPVVIKQEVKVLTAASVEQLGFVVSERNQTEALCRYLDSIEDIYAIIFCKTKIGAKELSDELMSRGYPTDALHGDMVQDQRDMTMKRFKDKKIQLLVCTDVAARGIDVSDLTHVINFSLPQDNESYVHRIGRTGRGGKTGISLSIITPAEEFRVRQIERITKADIKRIPIPKVEDIKKVLLDKAFKQIVAYGARVDSQEFSNGDFEFFKQEFAEMSKDDVLKSLFGLVYDQKLAHYKDAKDIELRARPQSDRGAGAARRGGSSNYDRPERGNEAILRFSLDAGGVNGMTAGDLIRIVCKSTGLRGNEIGRIQIKDSVTYFDVTNPPLATKTIGQSKRIQWNGASMMISQVEGDIGRDSSGPRGGGSSAGAARRPSSGAPRREYSSSSAPRGASASAPRGERPSYRRSFE